MRAKQKRKMRKSTKFAYVIIATVLILISGTHLLKSFFSNNMTSTTKEIYSYTNKFNYDYNVNLIDNKFINNPEISGQNIAYVTDLIDNVVLNLNYSYSASTTTELKYSYSVVGKMQVVYTKDGEEQKIWQEDDLLLDKSSETISSNTFSFNEEITLDLKNKNELLNEFKQKMGMSIDAIYTVLLNVYTYTNFDQDIENNYSASINLDLAEKTTKITGENNKEDAEYISKEVQENSNANVFVIILDFVILAIGIKLLRTILKTGTAYKTKNEYKQELNRILKLCQDKIVQVSSKPDDKSDNIVIVKDFGEIVKVSEELFKPILYYYDMTNEEAWFSVMSNNIVYRYIFKK